MKSYAARRATWIDRQLLRDYRPLPPPEIAWASPPDSTAGPLRFRLASEPAPEIGAIQWRLAEVTLTNSLAFNPRQPWKYEINAIWEREAKEPTAELPGQLLAPNHVYRVRARWRNADGSWSRWSGPVQFEAKTKH